MTCIVEGCEREVYVKSRGLCGMHYSRWWRYGDTSVVNPAGFRPRLLAVCKFDGCEELEKKGCRGWCAMHHTRWYRHGDPSINGNKLRAPTPTFTRILDRLSIGGFNECWVWQGARLPNGYGLIGVKGNTRWVNRYVHRLTYEHFRGPIPVGLHLHHLCEVKSCANPKHLIPVTRREHAAAHRKVAA